MIKFHKNGTMLIKDKEGKVYVFDPKESLKDIANYIWGEPSLADYKVIADEKINDSRKIIFVDLSKKEKQRLREFSEIMSDTYYEET